MTAADDELTTRDKRAWAASEPGRRLVPVTLERSALPALAVVTMAMGCILAITVGGSKPILLVATAYIAIVGIWLAIIDLRTHRLPDRIVVPSCGVVIALLVLSTVIEADVAPLGRAAIAAAVTGLVYAALNRWGSMGFGDVKLGILLGIILGWASGNAAIAGPVIGFLLAFVVAVGLLIAGRGRRAHLAFGPYLIGGALLALVQNLATR